MNKDFVGGIFLSNVGLIFLIYSLQYEFGNLKNIGPGFFPTVVSVLLTVFGLCILIFSFLKNKDIFSFDSKSLLSILMSVFLFGFALEIFGLIFSITLAILPFWFLFKLKFVETLLLSISLIFFNYFLFSIFLQIPIKLF